MRVTIDSFERECTTTVPRHISATPSTGLLSCHDFTIDHYLVDSHFPPSLELGVLLSSGKQDIYLALQYDKSGHDEDRSEPFEHTRPTDMVIYLRKDMRSGGLLAGEILGHLWRHILQLYQEISDHVLRAHTSE